MKSRLIGLTVCVLACTGGCYEHRTVSEREISPIDLADEDAGSDDNAGGDGESDAGSDATPGLPEAPTAQECEDAAEDDVLMQILCAASGAGNGGSDVGAAPPSIDDILEPPTPLECLTSQDALTKLLCMLQSGGNANPGAGFPTPTPAECAKAADDDFLTQILCALGNGGGFPGAGTTLRL